MLQAKKFLFDIFTQLTNNSFYLIFFLFESESMSATKNEINQAKKWTNNSNIISPNISN